MKIEILKEMKRNRETLKPSWKRLREEKTPRSLGIPRPQLFKKYEGVDTIQLLEVFPNIKQKTLHEVISSRRSLRAYKNIALTLEELSYLLYETSRVQRYQDNAVFRTIPTGGATNSLETYIYANNIDGVKQGLYHYTQHEHTLSLLVDGNLKDEVNQALSGQLRKAPVAFFFTCVPERGEHKYTFTAHKMIAMEAGHAGQNLHLASEVIDCGAVMLAAYNQDDSDQLLKLDTNHEFTIYAATLGKK